MTEISVTENQEMNVEFKLENIQRRARNFQARGFILVVGFLCLGFLSACSGVRDEVISNKQATEAALNHTYGTVDSSGDRSLWNVSHKQFN